MIHPTAIIQGDTWIDDSAEIGPWCLIGSDHGPLYIGPGSIVRSHTIIEGGNHFDDRLETGHHALIRTGNEIGLNLRIGSYSSLEGGGKIGDFVRIHGRCEMTKGVINHFARVYGGTYITDNRLPPSNVNDPAILDEGSVVCMNSVVIAGVLVGLGSFVGASTVVSSDLPDVTALVGGKYKSIDELHWKGYHYPWTGYFKDGYPGDAHPRIAKLHTRIMEKLQ
jgi:carbonic anhydrase/acetyltransferase-like protein (isoleucine patch superfamily)